MTSNEVSRPGVRFGQRTDVGKIRSENQDALGVWESSDDDVFARKGRLLVVCDGMGGTKGGRLASTLAIETIISSYREHESEAIHEAMWHAIGAANTAVHAKSNEEGQDELRGMGTTVCALVHHEQRVHLAHVGDSRIYMIRGEEIVQLTRDHTVVQDLIDKGELAPEDVESHPDKSVLNRSLGPNQYVQADLAFGDIEPGDTYLLCSDGLTGLVSDEEIRRIVSIGLDAGYDLDRICGQLVDLANAYMGHDNITVQLLHVPGEPAPEPAEDEPE